MPIVSFSKFPINKSPQGDWNIQSIVSLGIFLNCLFPINKSPQGDWNIGGCQRVAVAEQSFLLINPRKGTETISDLFVLNDYFWVSY